ncbi:MAG: NUDIX hydrolase [Desulfovibrio sp.]|nr:NUDIX hydrolase [Desulfovibrio sp.]
MKKEIKCPACGGSIEAYANPAPTVDVVIYSPEKGVVVIKRENIPHGYALPGGFIDEGEQAEAAAIREAKEETNLDIRLTGLLGVYSRPDRDPRRHTMSMVYVCEAANPDELRAGDDAGQAAFYSLDNLPSPIVFDHDQIISDFKEYLVGERSLAPVQPL